MFNHPYPAVEHLRSQLPTPMRAEPMLPMGMTPVISNRYGFEAKVYSCDFANDDASFPVQATKLMNDIAVVTDDLNNHRCDISATMNNGILDYRFSMPEESDVRYVFSNSVRSSIIELFRTCNAQYDQVIAAMLQEYVDASHYVKFLSGSAIDLSTFTVIGASNFDHVRHLRNFKETKAAVFMVLDNDKIIGLTQYDNVYCLNYGGRPTSQFLALFK